MTSEYVEIEQRFSNMISEYKNLLKGVSAYVQMNDDFENEDIYTLLGLLIGDSLDEFRNVAILKDTTIRWTYPRKGNEKSLGVDLSKVEGQSKDVIFVKENLKEVIVGPIDLVQGGRGFIIRIPILKNKNYWGMSSFVLKTEVVFEFLRIFEKDNNIRLLIMHSDKEKGIIYGNKEILSLKPLLYESPGKVNTWDIYIVPANGWFEFHKYFALLSFLNFMICWYIIYKINKHYLKYYKLEKRNKEIIAKSAKDSFTGIYNRGYFDVAVIEEMENSDKLNSDLSMIYFDLDYFKSINDTYGHVKGDLVLLETTKKVRKCLRDYDIFSRWGGDEFIILLPETDLNIAINIAKRIKKVINNIQVAEERRLSASIGVTQRANNEFFESWFKRIDQALYIAKENGRDQINSLEYNDDNVRLKILWDKKWNSGKKWIDDDHINLVNMANDLIKSSFNSVNYDKTIRKADDFIRELKNHFESEISFLRGMGYPKVEAHYREHQELLKGIETLYDKILSNNAIPEELIFFLENKFLIGHLIKKDSYYRTFLNNK